MRTVVVFIDAGYIIKTLENESDKPKVDYEKVVKEVVNKFDEDVNLLRTYFYDCPPHQIVNVPYPYKTHGINPSSFSSGAS